MGIRNYPHPKVSPPRGFIYINSWLSRCCAARESCTSPVTVGPLKYKAACKSILFTNDPSIVEIKNSGLTKLANFIFTLMCQ